MKTTKTYNGRPCKKCGATLRYSSTCACVACSIKKGLEKHYKSMGKIFTGVELSERQISSLNYEDAKEKGHKLYHGMKCRNCGNTLRYTSSRGCVDCLSVRYEKKRKESVPIEKFLEKKTASYNYDLAKEKNFSHFHGMKCKQCGNTVRYTSTKACIFSYKHKK
jgi:hypothetical protein